MLNTHEQLVRLVADGVIEGVPPENINAASIDLTLGPVIRVEVPCALITWPDPIDLAVRQSICTRPITMDASGYVLEPGEFLLASTNEVFHLPAGSHPEILSGQGYQPNLEMVLAVAGEYKLKSTLARNGLGHLLAGWCDPGWSGSVLTLELHNTTRYHRLRIRPGMKIGQIVLWSGAPVTPEASYAARGQYNHDRTATPSKGLR